VTQPSTVRHTPQQTADKIRAVTAQVVQSINDFTSRTFRTRGGRMGSGMGGILEGLYGYYATQHLEKYGLELAWMSDHAYNDFAVVDDAENWDPATTAGELLRIEMKSMNFGTDEPKAHFDEIQEALSPDDLLVVLVWRWQPEDTGWRSWPKVADVFVDRALPVAELRDALHLQRGGSFVRDPCPDGCAPTPCSHFGEPLNREGTRERRTGPISRKPKNSDYGANFGGLKRMLGTRGAAALQLKADICKANPAAAEYVRFIERNLAPGS